MEKHDSYDIPPDKPFWKGRKRLSNDQLNPVDKRRSPESALSSPSEKIGIRSELITQLQKWHSLLESGVISQSDYEELRSTILSDIEDNFTEMKSNKGKRNKTN